MSSRTVLRILIFGWLMLGLNHAAGLLLVMLANTIPPYCLYK
jgi:hypothetical protein